MPWTPFYRWPDSPAPISCAFTSGQERPGRRRWHLGEHRPIRNSGHGLNHAQEGRWPDAGEHPAVRRGHTRTRIATNRRVTLPVLEANSRPVAATNPVTNCLVPVILTPPESTQPDWPESGQPVAKCPFVRLSSTQFDSPFGIVLFKAVPYPMPRIELAKWCGQVVSPDVLFPHNGKRTYPAQGRASSR